MGGGYGGGLVSKPPFVLGRIFERSTADGDLLWNQTGSCRLLPSLNEGTQNSKAHLLKHTVARSCSWTVGTLHCRLP